LWAGASAKVLLADAEDALLARIVADAPAGRADLDKLRNAVAEVRKTGFAVSHGERESGVSAVAVPLLDDTGSVVAALSMSGATPRFTDDRVEYFASALRSAAVAMSGRALGTALRGASA
jgi:DNA-binding IclR family transcriptional regulator